MSSGLGTRVLVILAPTNEPTAPITSSVGMTMKSHFAVVKCGINDVKDGGVTANALMPAARLGSFPRTMSVGISRNPGPTPRNPLKTEMGKASATNVINFSRCTIASAFLNSLYTR